MLIHGVLGSQTDGQGGVAPGLFLATNGSDSNPGTQAQPFGTLAHAMAQLSPGDRLNIRGGTYRTGAFTWTKSGTTGSRVVIASYTGEVAVLDANIADFQTTGLGLWELHDAATATYRSAASYSSPTSWIGSIVIAGKLYRLLRYQTLTSLMMSTVYTWVSSGEFYRGPGFILHTDGRFYIRIHNLASPRDAGVPAAAPAGASIRNTPPSAGGFDPNTFVVNLSNIADTFTVAANNLTFERLAFHGGDRGPLMGDTTNITYQNCEIYGQRINIRFNPNNDNIQILSCDTDNGVPPWISWYEVKTDETNHPGMKMSLITTDINNSNVLVQDCRIRSAFDGMASPGTGCDNLRFLNNTWDFLMDDTVQFNGDLLNFEFAYNYVIGPGPGYDGSASSAAATKWFHHNVFDIRRDEFGWRVGHTQSDSAWRESHVPFATHSATGNMPAKIYNNTILYGLSINNAGCRIERQGANTAGLHEAYNNIAIAYTAHSYVRGVSVGSTDQILDHNIIHNIGAYTVGPFREWPDAAGEAAVNFASLAAWLASPGFTFSQSVYAPGFEANSKQQDPLLGDPDAADYRPSAAGPASSGAKNLASTGWPGATSAVWFGAVDPSASTGLGGVGHSGTAGPR